MRVCVGPGQKRKKMRQTRTDFYDNVFQVRVPCWRILFRLEHNKLTNENATWCQ